MFTFQRICILSLAAGSAIAAPFRVLPRAATGLNTAAQAAGKLYFGTATQATGESTDTAYMTETNNTADFGQLTPVNSMKWDAVEPSQNTFTYGQADALVAQAEANGQKMRCHNLVGRFDDGTLYGTLRLTHVLCYEGLVQPTTVVGH